MKKKQNGIKLAVTGILFVIFLIVGYQLLSDDYLDFIKWWLTAAVTGIIFLPVTSLIFHRFHDNGWLFSKTIGIAVSGWMLWYFSSVKWMKFTQNNAYICLGICLACNFLLMIGMIKWSKKREEAELFSLSTDKFLGWNIEKINHVLREELLFFLFFLVWTYIRGFKPEAYGTEKFMNYGFMTTMMRTEYFPAQDLWLAGEHLNYYYLGQYLATYLSKLSGVGVEKGYNLMLMMIAAFSFTLPYSLIYNVTKTLLSDIYAKGKTVVQGGKERFAVLRRYLPAATGGLAGTAVLLAGSMHYPIYNWIIPMIQKMQGKEQSSYWFPNATRYIGYNPPTSDKTIHEFPAYSFVLGDLHAHVINIMFVLTVAGILFAWLLYRKKAMDRIREGSYIDLPVMQKEVMHPAILMIGFFIGLFHMTNYWDFPIYFVVAGAVILFSNAVIYGFRLKTILLTALHAAVIVIIGELVCLPFTLSFNQISSSIRFTESTTPFYQLMVLWGLPIAVTLYFCIAQYNTLRKMGKIRDLDEQDNVAADNTQKKGRKDKNKDKITKNKLFQYIEQLNTSDLFIITIGLCAFGLVLIPEVVYILDIYSGDYKRANTMFKLTYQAFILFGMGMSYMLVKFLIYGRRKIQQGFAIIGLFLLISTVGYIQKSVDSWYGNIFKKEGYKGLDASAFMQKESQDDFEATNWLNENVKGRPVILEADGDSYTFYERVSVITGLPTVLGWRTHEWLWQSDSGGKYPKKLSIRSADIKTIYTSDDEQLIHSLLDRYQITYIYVGKLEEDKYEEPLNHDRLKSLGTVVFEKPVDEFKDYPTYIVKVK